MKSFLFLFFLIFFIVSCTEENNFSSGNPKQRKGIIDVENIEINGENYIEIKNKSETGSLFIIRASIFPNEYWSLQDIDGNTISEKTMEKYIDPLSSMKLKIIGNKVNCSDSDISEANKFIEMTNDVYKEGVCITNFHENTCARLVITSQAENENGCFSVDIL